MRESQDELARAYARIIAMRANLSESPAVSPSFGPEYDALVDRAARASGLDLSEFKIGDDHKIPHADAYLVDGFLSRVDGLLAYLRTQMPEATVRKIGFQ